MRKGVGQEEGVSVLKIRIDVSSIGVAQDAGSSIPEQKIKNVALIQKHSYFGI